MPSSFHIVYYQGDTSKLSVAEIPEGQEYEIYEYSVASRQTFYNEQEARKYAKELAIKHGLEYIKDHYEPAEYLD